MLELITRCMTHALIEMTKGQREWALWFQCKCSIWPKVQIAAMCMHALDEERYCLIRASHNAASKSSFLCPCTPCTTALATRRRMEAISWRIWHIKMGTEMNSIWFTRNNTFKHYPRFCLICLIIYACCCTRKEMYLAFALFLSMLGRRRLAPSRIIFNGSSHFEACLQPAFTQNDLESISNDGIHKKQFIGTGTLSFCK